MNIATAKTVNIKDKQAIAIYVDFMDCQVVSLPPLPL